MIEKIIKIEEECIKYNNKEMEGYKIITSKQNIYLLISNEQHCCENWGYLSSVDNFDDFIGADLYDVKEVDENYVVTSIADQLDKGEKESAIFINLETSKGMLQFVLYNSHNGYYGHSYFVKSEKLNGEGVL